jgi:hypothetical protein
LEYGSLFCVDYLDVQLQDNIRITLSKMGTDISASIALKDGTFLLLHQSFIFQKMYKQIAFSSI